MHGTGHLTTSWKQKQTILKNKKRNGSGLQRDTTFIQVGATTVSTLYIYEGLHNVQASHGEQRHHTWTSPQHPHHRKTMRPYKLLVTQCDVSGHRVSFTVSFGGQHIRQHKQAMASLRTPIFLLRGLLLCRQCSIRTSTSITFQYDTVYKAAVSLIKEKRRRLGRPLSSVWSVTTWTTCKRISTQNSKQGQPTKENKGNKAEQI